VPRLVTPFEIFWRDLIPETQERILWTYDLKSHLEANWDVVPIAIVEIEMDNVTSGWDVTD